MNKLKEKNIILQVDQNQALTRVIYKTPEHAKLRRAAVGVDEDLRVLRHGRTDLRPSS